MIAPNEKERVCANQQGTDPVLGDAREPGGKIGVAAGVDDRKLYSERMRLRDYVLNLPLRVRTGRVHDGRTILYRASTRDCGSCHIKAKCTPNMTFRKIPRDVHEDARDVARALMGKPEFAKSRDERKRVEMRFAHLKTHHRFERMRLRGLSGARDEFHLAAIVQNLKTLANHIWRPPPNAMNVVPA